MTVLDADKILSGKDLLTSMFGQFGLDLLFFELQWKILLDHLRVLNKV